MLHRLTLRCGATTEVDESYQLAVKRSVLEYDLRSHDPRHHHGLSQEAVNATRYVHPPLSTRSSCGISHTSFNRSGAFLVVQGFLCDCRVFTALFPCVGCVPRRSGVDPSFARH